MNRDTGVFFPVVEGAEGRLVTIAARPFQDEDYRSAFLQGTMHIGALGAAGSHLRRWGAAVAGWRGDFANHPWELIYPGIALDGESFDLAAAIAWLRAPGGCAGLPRLAASAALGEGGAIVALKDKEGAFGVKLNAVLDAEPRPDAFLLAASQNLEAYGALVDEMRREGIELVAVAHLDDCAAYWRAAAGSPIPPKPTRKKEKAMVSPLIGSSLVAGVLAGLVWFNGNDRSYSPVPEHWTPRPVMPVLPAPTPASAPVSIPEPLGVLAAQPPLPADAPVTQCVSATGNADMDRLEAEMLAEAAWGRRSGFSASYRSTTTRSRGGSETEEHAERSYQGRIEGVSVLRTEQRDGQWCVTIGPVAGG